MQLPRKYAEKIHTAVPCPHHGTNHILFPETQEVLHVTTEIYDHVCRLADKREAAAEAEAEAEALAAAAGEHV
jgi:hypothetical protein